MTIINTNFKANDVIQGTETTSQDAYIQELRIRVEEALRDLDQFTEGNQQWMNEELLRKSEFLAVTLKAEAAALAANGVQGYNADGTPADTMLELPPALNPLWNVSENGTIRIRDNARDAEYFENADEYQGTVYHEDSRLAFSLQDENIDRLDVITKGKDLIYTLTYLDGSKKSWVLKDGTVSATTLIIESTQMTHGVTIDLSGAIRVGDGTYLPYGTDSGFQVHGSMFRDRIYGSQGADGIAGFGGNDFVNAMGGSDTVFGDGVYSAGAFGEEGGDDELSGGSGNDRIYGGSGIDIGYNSDKDEVVEDMGGGFRDDTTRLPSLSDWMNLDSNWEAERDENGDVILRRIGEEGGTIDITTMPAGFENVIASMEPERMTLVLTFTGKNSRGNPITATMRIEGFFDEPPGCDPSAAVTTLNVTGNDEGNILDFHNAFVTNQNINLYGAGEDDIVLGVQSRMLAEGVDIENITRSSISAGRLRNYESQDPFAYSDDEDLFEGYESSVEGGYINISAAEEPAVSAASLDDTSVTIVAPEGFNHGYTYINPSDGRTYVTLVNNEGETIVYRFDSEYLDYTNIFFVDRRPESVTEDDPSVTPVSPIELIPFSFEEVMYTLSGGEGSDMIFGYGGSNFETDGDDFVVRGEMDDDTPEE